MTRMTVLHFASPFAFSMPVPARATRADPGGIEPATPADLAAAEAASARAGSGVGLGISPLGDAADPASDGPGARPGTYDMVVRRYREHDGAGPQGTDPQPTDPQARVPADDLSA